MKNLKTIGIVFAVLLVVIVIAIVFKNNWISLVNAFLGWIQNLLGVDSKNQFQFADNIKDSTTF